jgi:tRNA (guanine10-N2)-dimethyltransferase
MERKSEILCFEVSQEHPTIPKSEILAVTHGEIIEEYPGVLIVKVENPDYKRLQELGMCYRVSKILGSGDFHDICEISEEIPLSGSFRVRAVRKCEDISSSKVEREIGRRIKKKGLKVDLKNPDFEIRVILTDKCHLGIKLFECARKEIIKRKPHKMRFFHPGVMLPQFSRAIVNISEVKNGEKLLDPFCGTGGILYEAERIRMRTFGVDVQPKMIFGARKNILGELVIGDAKKLPFRDSSFHAVVSDFPYGRSSSLSDEQEKLYSEALWEIHRVLKDFRRAVIVTNRDIKELLPPLFRLEELHKHRVHKSLMRYFWVLRK